jgi:CubicO group peptidase (beta-lactamase class C family)
MIAPARVRTVALAVGVAILTLGCSGDSDSSSSARTDAPAASTTRAATSVAPATTVAPATSPTTVATPDLEIADGLVPLPSQPDDVPFPTGRWPVGELPASVSRDDLDAAVRMAFGSDPEGHVRSLVVVQNGKLVYEAYNSPNTAATVMASFSVAKSFTSAVVGLLVGDGLLDVNDAAPVEAWSDPDDPRHQITIAQLLHMSSGLEWNEDFSGGPSDLLRMLVAPSAADVAASKPLEFEPDTVFEYSTGTTAILSRIIADTLGGSDKAIDFIRQRLFQPIGITTTNLLRDPGGTWYGGLGADSTAQDFARFGLLFLRNGMWDGVRILPQDWVDYSRSPSSTNESYGAQWWMRGPDGTFSAQGLFGQQIILDPIHDLVIVTTSNPGGDPYTLSDTVLRLFTA